MFGRPENFFPGEFSGRATLYLSMNRPTPDPSQEGNRRRSASCPFPSWEGLGVGSWSQCMFKSDWRLLTSRNSQIRMTNHEIRKNTEIRMTKSPIALLSALRHSSFEFISSFVIRHSAASTNHIHGRHARQTGPGGADRRHPGFWNSTIRLVFVPLKLLSTPQQLAVLVNIWSLMSTSAARNPPA